MSPSPQVPGEQPPSSLQLLLLKGAAVCQQVLHKVTQLQVCPCNQVVPSNGNKMQRAYRRFQSTLGILLQLSSKLQGHLDRECA